jgi:hypothetical protein
MMATDPRQPHHRHPVDCGRRGVSFSELLITHVNNDDFAIAIDKPNSHSRTRNKKTSLALVFLFLSAVILNGKVAVSALCVFGAGIY